MNYLRFYRAYHRARHANDATSHPWSLDSGVAIKLIDFRANVLLIQFPRYVLTWNRPARNRFKAATVPLSHELRASITICLLLVILPGLFCFILAFDIQRTQLIPLVYIETLAEFAEYSRKLYVSFPIIRYWKVHRGELETLFACQTKQA